MPHRRIAALEESLARTEAREAHVRRAFALSIAALIAALGDPHDLPSDKRLSAYGALGALYPVRYDLQAALCALPRVEIEGGSSGRSVAVRDLVALIESAHDETGGIFACVGIAMNGD